jgi:4-amino-4-deoxy-L-arabinose transferase-like glycosyltransferase
VSSGRRRDPWLVLAVGLVARLGVVAWGASRFPASEDGHYYDVLARRLASGAGYTWLWPDGAVTYAAHYPVGYPGLLALAYSVFGASAGVAMMVNAVVGAVAALAAYRLVDGADVPRWRPLAAGLVVALHPALVPYTAAVMTEGVTAALLIVAAALAVGARGRRARAWPWLVALGVVLGVATLVRPQSLVLAPVLGALAARAGTGARARLARAAVASMVALACVAPWTARNCVRMNRCALVSVNGGWNLLIGAQSTSGAWEPVAVPSECATTWDEAGKDACFERAARRAIGSTPRAWLARAPAKMAATLDYFGAAPWYLHAVDPEAFGDDAKTRLAVVETIACRLLLLGALWAVAYRTGRRRRARVAIAIAGALAALTPHGWLGYAAIVVAVALLGRRAIASAPVVVPATAAVIAATAVVHVVFFGAGRYGLVVVPFVTALAFTWRTSSVASSGQGRGAASAPDA